MKRSRDIRWAEVRVGVFLIVALVMVALAVIAVGRKVQLFTPKSKVQVLLPNVQGLKVGAPVWLSGVMIGTVADKNREFFQGRFDDLVKEIREQTETTARELAHA